MRRRFIRRSIEARARARLADAEARTKRARSLAA
jgi:hypothetical protein